MGSPSPHSGLESCPSEEPGLFPDFYDPVDNGVWANPDHPLPSIEEETPSERSSVQSPDTPFNPLRRYLEDLQTYELIALGLGSHVVLSPSGHHHHNQQYLPLEKSGYTSDSSSDTWSMAAEPGADLPYPIERYANSFESHERLAVAMEQDPKPPGEALSPPESEGHSISLSSPSPEQSAVSPMSLKHSPPLEVDSEGEVEVEDYAIDVRNFLASIRRRRMRERGVQYRVARRRLAWEQRKSCREFRRGARASP